MRQREPHFWRTTFLIAAVSLFAVLHVYAVPQLINFQGRVKVKGSPFDSAAAGKDGLFNFALVNAAGDETFWSNDGTSSAGAEPSNAVGLKVKRGLYSVLLGDATLTNMTVLPASVFADNEEVFIRVWFDDGANGSQQLAPDQLRRCVNWPRSS